MGVYGRLIAPRTLKVRSLNVCGCSTDEMKREVIGRIFVRCKLDGLAMIETKLKSKGERKFGSALGRVSGVDGGRGGEGVGSTLKLCDEEYKRVVSGVFMNYVGKGSVGSREVGVCEYVCS